ncbi:MAG: hypothetical protein AAF830_08420 [Pseudomonadota bacterium]
MMKWLASAFAAALFAASSASAATVLVNVSASVYDSSSQMNTVDDWIAFANANPAVATFDVSSLNYPANSNTIKSNKMISEMIGGDASTLSGLDIKLETTVWVFEGMIDLAGGTQTFSVGSDDGFALFIDGVEVSRRTAPRGFDWTDVTGDFGTGLKTFKLVYYENQGNTGVALKIDGVVADNIMSVPAPSSGVLMGFLLAGLAITPRVRRR